MSVPLSLPPAMVDELERVARREKRTPAELLEEAVRTYLLRAQLRDLQRYGARRAQQLGLEQAEIERLIDEYHRVKRRLARNRLRAVMDRGLVSIGSDTWSRDELYDR